MLHPGWVIGASALYFLLLAALASLGDRRAAQGRSIIANPWVYALSWAVYCTAWTYFGSVGRAATGGVWFLPIYLGPTLAMIVGWMVLRKILRIAKTYRITSIADFIGSRYGKSPLLAALVTLIALVGVVPYVALQLKAVSVAYTLLTQGLHAPQSAPVSWLRDGTFYLALALAGFTMVFGARHLDATERHEGLVAAIAFESLVKLLAFLAVGGFVVWGMFGGLGDLLAQARALPDFSRLVRLRTETGFPATQWFALIFLALCSVILLPRQFHIMVVENVDERHLHRALWVFPLYLLAINVFVLPLALGGLLVFEGQSVPADSYVLALPLAAGQPLLALAAFLGGLSAATGMVIVETIAVSTMVCNDWVLPLLLRTARFRSHAGAVLTGWLLGVRRAAIVLIMVLGYAYYHLAGEAYALVSIGLISFAAVAQFAPAMLAGLYWKGATRRGAVVGLLAGFGVWAYTLLWPSLAKSGWLDDAFLRQGPWGLAWLRPEQLLGLSGLDPLTHSLFWSLLVNAAALVTLSLWRGPSGAEASQALLFVDVFERSRQPGPVFWRGQATVADLQRLCQRYLGPDKAQALWQDYARARGCAVSELRADADMVHHVETQLAGAVGSASARALISSTVQEDVLSADDVMRILDEASALRAYSRALEEKSASLERASAELRVANEQLKSLDRLKDDFMSSVTHELRTPLTSIRAFAEILREDPEIPLTQRREFIDIIVNETERLSRLVNQVLDLAKIESGHAQWHATEVDVVTLTRQALATTRQLMQERAVQLGTDLPAQPVLLHTDPDRFTQVLINLLSNAVKFVPSPGGRVDVSLWTDDQGVTVSVRDNGPGVPKDQQALIFQKFRQGADAAHRPQGTGLGLTISRQIVEHFGGRLWLESDPGQGAAFCFFLPYKKSEET
ncbi:MAG: ATP-binding protein [Rhodoferax sp.]